MADSYLFGIYMHHGGKFVKLGKSTKYVGGEIVVLSGFDRDRFGYLDLEDEVFKLGYKSWACLEFKVPRTHDFNPVLDDKDVMFLLQYVTPQCKFIEIFVDEGSKDISFEEDVINASVKGKEIATFVTGNESNKGKEIHLEDEVCDSDYEDGDYILEEEEKYDTEDSLDDSELGSEDDEYKKARVNIRLSSDVIDDVEWNKVVEPRLIDIIDEEGRLEGEGFESDYVDSAEDVCSDSTDEDLDGVRKREPKILYDPRCDHKEMELKLGMRFQNGYECREALRTWAVYKGYPIHFKRCSKKQVDAYCESPCKWRCYGSMIKSHHTFAIKVLVEPHSCAFSIKNKIANYKWIAKEYVNVLRFRPYMSVNELQDDIIQKYAIQPSRGRLYRAKTEALHMLRGSVSHHYGTLRSYISELMRVDREGRYELLTSGTIFKALYIGFSALRKGFMEGCRRIIGLDGCFLKTHLGGQLLCAIAKDGNNQMYPIAWAVVEVENELCWRWFLKILLEELGINDGLGITFISDQQKGLQNAVKELAPFAEHRNCARHVYCNWKKQFKGATLKNLFWRAVRSTYREEFDAAVEEMKKENQAAYDDFMERDHQRFCKVFVSTHCNSDMVDNNVSETFNGYIVATRGKHIINMLEDIRVALRERQYKKLEMVKNLSDRLCPNIRKKLEKAKYDSRLCHPHPGLGGKFEVQRFDDRFIVTLGDKSCTCRLWDITGIPCVHALSAINFMKQDADDYVHECYSIDMYLKAYTFGMEPINGEKMWPKVEGLLVKPPEVRIMPGRPKKKRKRDRDEIDTKNTSRLRRTGMTMTCQKCFEVGHNTRSCKNEAREKPKKTSGKRGRPRKTPLDSSNERSGATRTAATVGESSSSTAQLRKERSLARSGMGVLQSEVTGNIYLHGFHVGNANRVNFVPPRQRGRPRGGGARGGGRSAQSRGEGSTTTELPTQESQAK